MVLISPLLYSIHINAFVVHIRFENLQEGSILNVIMFTCELRIFVVRTKKPNLILCNCNVASSGYCVY